MKIFVVGGKSGSGKNEVAKMIEEFYIYKLLETWQEKNDTILNEMEKNQ